MRVRKARISGVSDSCIMVGTSEVRRRYQIPQQSYHSFSYEALSMYNKGRH